MMIACEATSRTNKQTNEQSTLHCTPRVFNQLAPTDQTTPASCVISRRTFHQTVLARALISQPSRNGPDRLLIQAVVVHSDSNPSRGGALLAIKCVHYHHHTNDSLMYPVPELKTNSAANCGPICRCITCYIRADPCDYLPELATRQGLRNQVEATVSESLSFVLSFCLAR